MKIVKAISPCGTHYVEIRKPNLGRLHVERNIAIVQAVLHGTGCARIARDFGISNQTVSNVVSRFCRTALVADRHKRSRLFWTPALRTRLTQKAWIAENNGWLRKALQIYDE